MLKGKYAYVIISILVVLIVGSIMFFAKPKESGTLERSNLSVTTKNVNYFRNISGCLAKPTEPGKYPGVVMIHEWWGLNDYIRDTAQKLAWEGFTVIAVDLFHGEVAATPEKARQLVSSLDKDEALSNMRSAVRYLKSEENVSRLASLGWCFGGGQSLQLALSGETLDATVIYYGDLVTDESRLATIHWPVLGVFGESDTAIPVAEAKNFHSTLDKLGIENEIYIYPGVGHAFANPTGGNYAPNETKDAWEKTIAFLNKHLKET